MVRYIAFAYVLLLTHLPDENRGHLLEAGFPQEVVSLLEAYAGTISKDANSPREPLPLSVPHLKIVKTSIGMLLNVTIGYGRVIS